VREVVEGEHEAHYTLGIDADHPGAGGGACRDVQPHRRGKAGKAKAWGGEKKKRYWERLREKRRNYPWLPSREAVIRTGELLADLDRKYVGSQNGTKEIGYSNPPKQEPSLPRNIDKKRSYMYRMLKNNEVEVRELVKKALEGEGIPMGRATHISQRFFGLAC